MTFSKDFNRHSTETGRWSGNVPTPPGPGPRTESPMLDKMNDGQRAALAAMLEFAAGGKRYFALHGPAGTGKTFLTQAFKDMVKGRVVFTAPTNKATRVLRQTLASPSYFPECKTIYSLLGLKMEADGEVKVLAKPDEVVDLTKVAVVIVDEGSMIPKVLREHIDAAAAASKVKFLFLLDPYQLPPVGESKSWVCDLPDRAVLTQVMRHDNQILTLATSLREQIDRPCPVLKFETDWADGQGVRKLMQDDFGQAVFNAAQAEVFSLAQHSKVIAWRNATVVQYNFLIRKAIFGEEAYKTWLPTDRLIVTEPARDFDDEPLASTDDEGTVQRVAVTDHPIAGEFKVWAIDVMTDDNKLVTLFALHASSQGAWDRRVKELAAEARTAPRKWKDFWSFKSMFHSVRHGYALTAHRSQGSTYETAYVDYRDILMNRERREAFQCLYVACTRPKKNLIMA